MKYSITLFFLVVMIFSCKKLCKPQAFTIKKSNVTTQLKLNGFYYGDFDTSSSNEVYVSLIVLYQNGILLTTGSLYGELEKTIGGIDKWGLSKKTRDVWGLFNCEDSSIIIENNISRQCGKWVENRRGEIINDSTFVLTQRELHTESGVETSTINQIFRFRAYAPKPDSTNKFIK